MNRHMNSISGRLSLRQPQRESLEILDRIAEIVPLKKERDLASALTAVKSEFPTVEDFERDFPSLCFALATGVGKTRLMGAFITYLYLAEGVRHFFVLAPNLTIYNKLITDFTPNTSKYVFQGIAEFATNPPIVVTGDNYEGGLGVRGATLYGDDDVHINIFNISKINTEVRGGKMPRIKRLSEYVGESYFDYLAGLDDLVLLMDESHHYRASAGMRAINELNPVLGLELTATPYTGSGTPQAFKNIVYSYPLFKALEDGFVKEPAAATRENFDPASYSVEQLDRLKLEDGIRVHESVKVELETYARQNDKQIVKPFMLVVAKDVAHANGLVATIKEESFFEGRYKDRVITVHSGQRGAEKDENVERLLAVENPLEPTEIVVHVNKLKEGWDVTNLYTIVPLRAAKAEILVEQTIGRGLRLPYGKQVGVPAVDRLTIVAHDKFEEIIDEANNPKSLIRAGVVIGRDIPMEKKEPIVVPPEVEAGITRSTANENSRARAPFSTSIEQEIAKATMDVVKKYEYLPGSSRLKSSEIEAEIVREVAETYAPVQETVNGTTKAADVRQVVEKALDLFVERTIDIPRIVVLPKGETTFGYSHFELNLRDVYLQPVDEDILIQHLRTHTRERVVSAAANVQEDRAEDYLVGALIDFDDISYDDHADLLYDLSNQVVEHLRSYLPDENAVRNVLQYHQRRLAEQVHAQMQNNQWESNGEVEYEVKVSKGFTTLRPNNYTALAGEKVRNFRAPVENLQRIRGMLFGGFRRCLYSIQKFDSDTERRFAMMLEDDEDQTLKWFKPAPNQFRIYYRSDQSYEPDFVVETSTAKFLCETKAANEIADPVVQAKKNAAVEWCRRATSHELQHGGKPWSYLLLPHDAIRASSTLKGLKAAYACT